MASPRTLVRALAWSCFTAANAVLAQSMTASVASTGADGAGAVRTTGTPTYNTILLNGTMRTFSVQYTPPAGIDETPPVLPNIYDPAAVDVQTVCPGYTASHVVNNAYGFTAKLSMIGDGSGCNVYGNDVRHLNLSVQYQSAYRLAIKVTPAYLDSTNITQYYVSDSHIPEPALDEDANVTSTNNDLQFFWNNKPSFNFAVLRKSTGDVLFNTAGSTLVFEDQFVEIVSSLPENYNLYGLGEVFHGLRLGNNFTRTFYAADAGDALDRNIYGTHPIYIDTRYYETDPTTGNMTLVTTNSTNSSAEYTSYSHGLYYRNTHGLEVRLNPSNITWRTLGGNLEMYFFTGPTPSDVIQQYQYGAVGYPTMQQYWTFGFHLCRWGYTNWTNVGEIVDSMRSFDIPLETMWNDIDYMEAYRDFQNDPYRFGYPEGKVLLDRLHANYQHYVPIVDSQLYIPNTNNASDAYNSYTRGNVSGVFLKNADGSEYIGTGWPGFTVFPDWHANNTQSWWTNELMRYHQNLSYDGIWIDLSEAASFCVGSCSDGLLQYNPIHPPFGLPGQPGSLTLTYPEAFNVTNATEASIAASMAASQSSMIAATATSTSSVPYLSTKPTPGVRNVTFPPYAINNVNGALAVHAVAGDAVHADGTQEYAIHNLFGHEILNATRNALLEVFPGKRPFIIGRSTFAGSGQLAGHWGGDNTALFSNMALSIPQALSFSIFGIPMFGVDTCGFAGNTDEELCSRWMQLSAFFPFYRNHNTLKANSQEPFRWAGVTTASKTAMDIRYRLLPYMYTLFYQAHTTGSTVMRAMAWEFPNDPSLANADRQFLLGPSLLITPVLTPLATTVGGVFPGAGSGGTVWYDWYNGSAIAAEKQQNMTIEAPLGHIPVHVRGGSVLPMQAPGYTTYESRQGAWSLLVALDKEGSATGQLYLDDGESLTPNATRYVDMTATGGNTLYASGRGLFADKNPLANVTILGVSRAPRNVTFNGQAVKAARYSAKAKSVSISGLGNATSTGAWNSDWVLKWA